MNSDLLVTIATQVTAITALFVAVWQTALGRKHNRQSVRPLLRVDVCGIRQAPFKGLVLTNVGLGPAIIENFAVTVNGQAMNGPAGGWSAARDSLGVPPGQLDVGWLGKGDVMAASESIHAFGLTENFAFDDDAIKRFFTKLRGVCLIVSYRSLHGEEFQLNFNVGQSGYEYAGYMASPGQAQQIAQSDRPASGGPAA